MPVERRWSERVAIRGEAVLVHNGTTAHLRVEDLSVGGAYLAVPLSDAIELKTGGRFALTLTIDEDTPCHAEEEGSTVHAMVRIVRRDPGGAGRPPGIGVAFEPADLENLARIQALVGRRRPD